MPNIRRIEHLTLQKHSHLRSMPMRDTLRYLKAGISRKSNLITLQIFGENVWLRAKSEDLYVAYESLGAELEVPISYFDANFAGTILDAGGFIGTTSIRFARKFPKATIVTVEPSPENFTILQQNVARFPNIIPVNAALSHKPGQARLNDRSTGAWGYTIVEQPDDKESPTGISEVVCVTIAELCRRANCDAFNLVKMDIEGAEDALLRSSTQWLPQTEVLIIELHERIVGGVTDRFECATADRVNLELSGEKILSIRK